MVELGFRSIVLGFAGTYYSTGELELAIEGSLKRDFMGVRLGRRLFRCVAGHPFKGREGGVETAEVPLAYSFGVMEAMRCRGVVLELVR